jgi:hypothetical protein
VKGEVMCFLVSLGKILENSEFQSNRSHDEGMVEVW